MLPWKAAGALHQQVQQQLAQREQHIQAREQLMQQQQQQQNAVQDEINPNSPIGNVNGNSANVNVQMQQQPVNNVTSLNVPPPPIPQSSTAANQSLGGPFNLSHVLHFLQTEFRRYERDRNEWEIERGEMRARIALLEGERRGNENARSDLLRRVRMLEFALKNERSKYLALSQGQNSKQGTQKVPTDERPSSPAGSSTESELGGSGSQKQQSEGKMSYTYDSDPPASSAPQITIAPPLSAVPPHLNNQTSSTRPPSSLSTNGQNGPSDGSSGLDRLSNFGDKGNTVGLNAMATLGGQGQSSWNPTIGRDPRGRARSRDYLKQCLQEITYLTSATTLNPLPEVSASGVPRPRKTMASPLPPPNAAPVMETSTSHLPQSLAPPPPFTATAASQSSPMVSVPIKLPERPAQQAFVSRSAVSVASPAVDPAAATPPLTETLSSLSKMDGGDLISAEVDETSAAAAATATEAAPSSPWNGTNGVILPPLPLDSVVKPPPTPSSPMRELPSIDPLSEITAATSKATPGEQVAEDAATPLTDVSSSSDVTSANWGAITNSEDGGGERLTAIFKPSQIATWKSQQQNENKKRQPFHTGNVKAGPTTATSIALDSLELQLNSMGLSDSKHDSDSASVTSDGVESLTSTSSAASLTPSEDSNSVWKSRKIFRSHLDAVRSLSFSATPDLALASAGDDMTVKVWRLNPHTLGSASDRGTPVSEVEPQVTLRGHSAAVTSVAVSPTSDRIYSASLDQTVSVWKLPPRDKETYAPFDANLKVGSLEGHTDAVWDIALLPLRIQEEGLLASASADGTVKIWNVDQLSSPLKLSWRYNGTEDESDGQANGIQKLPIPTSVATCLSDLRKVAVAYQNSVVKLFDIETGKQVLKLQSDETYDGTTNTQINQIVTHPTLPLLVTAHEDRYIRIFDTSTGECTHSMIAHQDAVTSIDIDSGGLNVISGGQDCSVRFWDLLTTRTCLQEISSHRPKGNEGVLSVKFHASLPYAASAGADGTVRMYSSNNN